MITFSEAAMPIYILDIYIRLVWLITYHNELLPLQTSYNDWESFVVKIPPAYVYQLHLKPLVALTLRFLGVAGVLQILCTLLVEILVWPEIRLKLHPTSRNVCTLSLFFVTKFSSSFHWFLIFFVTIFNPVELLTFSHRIGRIHGFQIWKQEQNHAPQASRWSLELVDYELPWNM